MNSSHLPIDDLSLAFEMAPVGLLVARNRVVQLYNRAFCDMFGYAPNALSEQSLESLYPSGQEFRHVGEIALAAMRDTGVYADQRIMKRLDGRLFWCHVSGQATDRFDPFALTVWVFEDMSAARRVTAELTLREREIAKYLVTGVTNKHIARELGVSPRTIEAHRARMMRKLGVASTTELIACLMNGQ